jgi:hypothetical protein
MAEKKSTVVSPSDDDRLWAALSYIFSPLVPVIALLLEDKKDNPYIRFHAIQSLIWGVAIFIMVFLAVFGSFLIIGICLIPLVFVMILGTFYYAYKAYQGDDFKIPVVTDLIRNQGWA